MEETKSPSPTCWSMKSDQSTAQTVTLEDDTFHRDIWSDDLSQKVPEMCDQPESDGSPRSVGDEMNRMESPAHSYLSMKSNCSMNIPITFNDDNIFPGIRSDDLSQKVPEMCDQPESDGSPRSVGGLPFNLLTEDEFRCSVCCDFLKDPVCIPCGHSHCRLCITAYWDNPDHTGSYACPQCRKRSRTRPVLYANSALAVMLQKLQQTGLSPAYPSRSYAELGDVACDLCVGRRLRAVKSCLTCTASYCENHVRQHYTVPALQRHKLVETTEKLEQMLCQIHHKPLEVLCKTKNTLICSLCAVEEHKHHDVVSVKSDDSEKMPPKAITDMTYETRCISGEYEEPIKVQKILS